MDPGALIKKLLAAAEAGFDAAVKLCRERLENYEKLCGKHMLSYPVEPCVMTFHELYAETKKIYGENLDLMIQEAADRARQNGADMQGAAIQIVKLLYDSCPYKKPMVIVGFIPPFYPDAYPDEDSQNTDRLLRCINTVINHAKQAYGQDLEVKNYYMGISDASYSGLNKRHKFDVFFKNLVGNEQIYSFPAQELSNISIPSVIVGGYGKDFHKCSERLNYSYNFNVLPFLYERLIEDLLSLD
jgi:arginine utilization protein RocB